MRRAAALALVLAVAAAARRLGTEESSLQGAELALGLALIAATLIGGAFESVSLPRISGYLLFGLACGPYLGGLISRSMARELQVVNGLAIALIAFIAGLEMNVRSLAPRLRAIAAAGAVVLALSYLVLFGALWAAWRWLPIWPEADGWTRASAAALLTSLVVSFSPTVSIAVIAESRARGPLSELVLSLVIMADLALVLVFTLAMQFARWTIGGGAGDGLAGRLLWEIFGSFAFGALLGSVFALYLRYIRREVTIVLLAVCALLAGLGARLHFEPLLAALAAGLVVENVAPPAGDALKRAIERGGLPVLIVFFVAAGAGLHLDAVAEIGVLAAAVAVLRGGTIRYATALGTRVAGLDPALGRLAWMGLVSQAGVTLGLTVLVASEFPPWGERVGTLVVALVALHVLVGPILFRSALARAGEAGRLDLEPAAP